MRLHEIMGIEANRKWGVCNLNEFRKVKLLLLYLIICSSHTTISSSVWSVSYPIDLPKGPSWCIPILAYASFLEWNSNPKVAENAEKLYGNIENLELYVGLQAEEIKPVIEGAGLCPGRLIHIFCQPNAQITSTRVHCQPCHPEWRYRTHSRRQVLHPGLYSS